MLRSEDSDEEKNIFDFANIEWEQQETSDSNISLEMEPEENFSEELESADCEKMSSSPIQMEKDSYTYFMKYYSNAEFSTMQESTETIEEKEKENDLEEKES